MNSIVLTAGGNRDLLARCLDAMKWNTDVPYELVLVDGSPAGYREPYTYAEVAKGLNRADRPLPLINIVSVGNVITAGVPSVKLSRIWNTGARAAKGDHIVITADDVFAGWHAFDHMLEVLDKFDIMCAYPTHTDIRPPPDFAKRARALASGSPQLSVGHESGFHGNAFSFTRACWEKYGPLDEQFQWACIDDDWGMWLTYNGHAPREVCSALIHHNVSGSVAGHLAKIPGLTEWVQRTDAEDRRRFFEKWHMGQRPARIG